MSWDVGWGGDDDGLVSVVCLAMEGLLEEDTPSITAKRLSDVEIWGQSKGFEGERFDIGIVLVSR